MLTKRDTDNSAKDVKVIGKASVLTLSKKSSPGDGGYALGRKGGGGGGIC